MLRSVSAKQLQEIVDFDQMESPELRMDLRFSILAGLIAASSGLQTLDGKHYTQAHYLQHLQECLERHDNWILGIQPAAKKALPESKQSTELMQQHIEDWMSGVNRSYYEKRGIRGDLPARPIRNSRQLLAERRGQA